ncbi:hypothetical protein D3C72_1799820 [compost metagenome]
MFHGIGPVALPQKLNRALGAIFRQHAGAAKLHEALARMARNEPGNVELACGIEAVIGERRFLSQQTIGADDLVFAVAFDRLVEHQQMIADAVPGIDVALAAHRICGKARLHFLDENPVTHGLRGINFAFISGEPCFQRAYTTEKTLIVLSCLGTRTNDNIAFTNVVIEDFGNHGESLRHQRIFLS